MKFYNSVSTERIGFDFYCDIANNIAKARQKKGWTQKVLAEKSGIRTSRLVQMENIKIRIGLEDIEKLARVLDRTVNWLIDAEMDCKGEECLYLICPESMKDFKLYIKATSSRMAFLIYDKRFKEARVAYSSSRERFLVKLVGVPVTKQELQDRFPKRVSEDLPLEPDE